jgi:uncharacterized protein YprB with RNaseH-like and TPR domain
MQVYNEKIDTPVTAYPLSLIASPEEVLYVDIETTGLSPARDRVYLVGCAYLQQGDWQLIQWFDETGDTEADILTSFLVFARKYKAFLHYNGDRFDLPFLRTRIEKCGLDKALHGLKVMEEKRSVDLFRVLKPYRKLLSLPNYQQQTVEAFMGSGRVEERSGGDLIQVYRAFIAAKNDEMERDLLGHNAADVRGLIAITPLLSLPDVFAKSLNVYKAQANHYRGFDGSAQEEIILFARIEGVPENAIPRPIVQTVDGCYSKVQGNEVTIKVPLYHGELKFFYANYREYYYLPDEDQALHKSIASFVDKSHRVQATAENCYTRKKGDFLPEWEQFRTPFFKHGYKDRYAYFEFTDAMKRDKKFFCDYAEYVFRHIIAQ